MGIGDKEVEVRQLGIVAMELNFIAYAKGYNLIELSRVITTMPLCRVSIWNRASSSEKWRNL